MDEIGETEGSVSGGACAGVAAAPPSRSAPRLSYEAVVRLSCAGRRGIHTGFVRDIARGGMFLRLVDPEPPGRRLGFELFLPGWRVPARGVGEVAWSRASYEGPGRPPGMAIRFVALEARAIEMLAALLPGGEVAEVEVLQPRPLPPVRRDERPATAVARVGEVGAGPAADAAEEPSLETLLAESGLAPLTQPATSEATFEEGLSDEDGPMIFVPPPPLLVPVPAPPAAPEVLSFAVEAPPESRLRWGSVRLGSAAAGIAAIAGLATLVVVGAARRDVLPPAEGGPPERSAVQAPAAAQPSAMAAIPAVPPAADPGGAGGSLAPPPGSMWPAPSAAEMPPAFEAPAAVEAPTAVKRRPAAAPPTSGSPATRLTGLTWEPLPSGGTRVAITLDGSFALSRLRASRIGGDTPRLVVRLLGLGAGAPRSPWEPATAEVRRIRAGRHDGDGGAEIHLVLDLASPDVRLTRSEVANGELRLDLVAVPGPDAGVR